MSTKSNRDLKRRRENLSRAIAFSLAAFFFIIPWVVEFSGLSPEGHRVFSIFMLAIVLWISEVIPLHATAALIIFLQILFVSDKALIPMSADFAAPKYSVYYASLANPILMLFLGGFFLADCSAKYRLDRNLARVLLKPFGTSPQKIMLGLMLITAFLSMFMSNTATTATMMAVVLPVMMSLSPSDRIRTGLALSIPIAANIGGMGTPVGTPPNAIALGALADAGISITFVQWMMMAMPFMLIALFFAWQVLCRLFPSEQTSIVLKIEGAFDQSRSAWIFYLTAIATIALWLTEPLHHVKSTIVGFLPVVVLLSTRVFTTKDMQSVQWHVLWLVAGGIALGTGVNASGLDTWLLGLVNWGSLAPGVIGGALCLVSLIMGSFISNSATANLLVPIAMSLALSAGIDINPILAAVFIAIGASLAMSLPISTPPNAIAYSSGVIKVKDMAKTGVIIGAFGLLLFVLVGPKLWAILGVIPK